MITWFLIKSKGKEFVIFLYTSIFLIITTLLVFNFWVSLITYLVCFMAYNIYSKFKLVSDNRFDIFFGPPGCGKSTVATLEALMYLKHDVKVNTFNLTIPGCNLIEDKKDLNINNPLLENSLFIIDEAGVDFDNRNFKDNFTKENVKFFKFHRHIHCDIIILSQSWNDIDLKLRNLSTRIYKVKKSFIPLFIKTKAIGKDTDIDDMTHQIADINSYIPFSGRYYYMPKSWKYFNSFTK